MTFYDPAINAANKIYVLLDELNRQPGINDRILEQSAIICVDALEKVLSSKEFYQASLRIKKNYQVHRKWTEESLADIREIKNLIKTEKELMRQAGLDPQIINEYFPSDRYLSDNFSDDLLEPDDVIAYVKKLLDIMREIRDDVSIYREKKKIANILKGAITGTFGIAASGVNGFVAMGEPAFAPISTISGLIGGLALREGWALVNKNQEKPTPPVIRI
ncbi:hypothetical protein [Azospirillum argentinense]|uniref:hypothetical protein n=1 Tax=Azospirillum argentinense TaxID=2970906 RepID=UPI0032DFE6B5